MRPQGREIKDLSLNDETVPLPNTNTHTHKAAPYVSLVGASPSIVTHPFFADKPAEAICASLQVPMPCRGSAHKHYACFRAGEMGEVRSVGPGRGDVSSGGGGRRFKPATVSAYQGPSAQAKTGHCTPTSRVHQPPHHSTGASKKSTRDHNRAQHDHHHHHSSSSSSHHHHQT